MSGLGLLRGRVAVLGAVIMAVLAAGAWVALSHASAHTYQPAAAGLGHEHLTGSPPPRAATALHVLSVTPAAHSTRVNGAEPISIVFTSALAADSPLPRVSPAIPGRWQRGGSTLQFLPAAGFRELTSVRVKIPAGSDGVRSASGGLLARPVTVRFRTAAYSDVRLDQLLAELGYLPQTWVPANSGEGASPGGAAVSASTTAATPLGEAYDPPAGYFRWHHGYPPELRRFWDGGAAASLIIDGAVRAFEFDHGLTMDGIAGPAVWKDLLAAEARGEDNTHGYTYAIAQEHLPETLTIWHNGREALRTLANTGIPGRTTVPGTFPVYLRYYDTIMKGTNPDGTKYADNVHFVSYFNGGDAVHWFIRGSYGFPQSLGCVEIPYAPAVKAYSLLSYGSLVTVNPP